MVMRCMAADGCLTLPAVRNEEALPALEACRVQEGALRDAGAGLDAGADMDAG
jgi:hypothetical protein